MMYEPFQGNYVWNLSVSMALAMGGVIGEIGDANDAVLQFAKDGEDSGTEAFFRAWGSLADRVKTLGDDAALAGHQLSAVEKYTRSVAYYMTAERMQSRDYEPRREMFRAMHDTFDLAIATGALNCERVEVPYQGTSFPALFVKGSGEGPRPCLVFCNGLDSLKEMIFLVVREAFAKRGISCLMVDQPGAGAALRERGLTAVVEAEHWASAAFDVLRDRDDVDADRIGVIGWSLGGFFAPRAAAYEPRFALCVAWGANHNWGALQQRRTAREGAMPVPHYWDHVMWVWGQPDIETFMQFVPRITLVDHLDRIKVPFLITHGANDRQIPVSDAEQSYREATCSPDAELKVFTDREGGVEHVSADNPEPVLSYIADWVMDRFAAMRINR